MREKYLENIKQRVAEAKAGSIFVLSDFSDIADTNAVRKAISRIENDQILLRIMRGVYYKPEYNALLEETVAPSPDAVAHAIARNFGWTIVPCGDTALNLLGISTQVPSQWAYVSDGPYKEYSFDKIGVKFKHTTNREISKVSYKTALTIQALKALGKENIDDSAIMRLKKTLTNDEKTKMFFEAKSATAWVYECIRQICKGEMK